MLNSCEAKLSAYGWFPLVLRYSIDSPVSLNFIRSSLDSINFIRFNFLDIIMDNNLPKN